MGPEKPLNRKSISLEKAREREVLKEDTARGRRIKRESSDGCDIDGGTVGKKGRADGRDRARKRRLRMSDQSTPGREPDTTRGDEFRIGGWS